MKTMFNGYRGIQIDFDSLQQCVYMPESLYASYLVQFSYRNHAIVFVRLCETLQLLLPLILQLKKTSKFQTSVKKLYLKPTEAIRIFSLFQEKLDWALIFKTQYLAIQALFLVVCKISGRLSAFSLSLLSLHM